MSLTNVMLIVLAFILIFVFKSLTDIQATLRHYLHSISESQKTTNWILKEKE